MADLDAAQSKARRARRGRAGRGRAGRGRAGRIGFASPVARALPGAALGDTRRLRRLSGAEGIAAPAIG